MHTTLLIGATNALTVIENIIGIPVALDLQQSWIWISPVSGTKWNNDTLQVEESICTVKVPFMKRKQISSPTPIYEYLIKWLDQIRKIYFDKK